MPLTRQRRWAIQGYHQFLVARRKTAFQWGVHDCALFAADGVESITGVDIAADFRGKYSDEAGALKLIKTVCGGTSVADAAAYCAQKHGLTELKNPRFAQRGDLVVFTAPTGARVAGLVHLGGQIVAVAEKGLYRFPISKIERAWRVG